MFSILASLSFHLTAALPYNSEVRRLALLDSASDLSEGHGDENGKPRMQRLLRQRRALEWPVPLTGDEKPLAFLHIPKTGGTLIEDKGFAQNITWGRHNWHGNQQGMPDGSYCSNHHVPPSMLNKPENVEIYTHSDVFCVVRHPYERAVSEYSYRLAVGGVPDFFFNETDCTAAGLNFFIQQSLLAYAGGRRFAFDCHLVPQYEYVFDGDGKEWCHHVIKTENLTDSFNALMATRHVDVRLDEARKGDFSFSNKCPRLSSADLHPTTKMMLDSVYAKDFRAFNYTSTAVHPADGDLFDVAHTVYEEKMTSLRRTSNFEDGSTITDNLVAGVNLKLLYELAFIKENNP